jgi:tetratricopeptide (TPR) repeat protein
MRRLWSVLSWLFLWGLSVPCLLSASTTLLPDELETLRQEGFNLLFNMEYEEARAKFDRMIEMDPEHPAGYIYLANSVWNHQLASRRLLQSRIYNRNNAFFRETTEQVEANMEKEFRENMSKGIRLAEKKLRTNQNDISSLYYLGVAKNIMAAYEATIRRKFFAAFRNGSKGVDLHKQVMKRDPTLIDAQLSVGLYNYIAGSLPIGIKILAFLGGVHGSKKDGLKMLEKVAKEGNYARDQASALLVMLYGREKRLEEGLKLLEHLYAKYPQNSFFRLEQAVTLADLGKFDESFDVFEAMLQDTKTVDFMGDMIHFQYAEALFDLRSWDKAREHYLQAVNSPPAPDALQTMAHLGAGKCLDSMGQRESAIAEYRTVLSRRETLDSRNQAKKYLKNPFKPEPQ